MAVKKGWTGRVYEDFEVGDVYEHPLGRTVLAADNTWFTLLTMNTQRLHFRPELRIQNGIRKTIGELLPDIGHRDGAVRYGYFAERFCKPRMGRGSATPNPVFEGDTLYAKSEVLEDTRIEISKHCGHCACENDRNEPAWCGGHRVPAFVHGVQARPRSRVL